MQAPGAAAVFQSAAAQMVSLRADPSYTCACDRHAQDPASSQLPWQLARSVHGQKDRLWDAAATAAV